ncbi:MAG: sulfatase-like hydrolase/transferase [Candidatus Hydrogenedentes bacterium]|nr:sulfatase-like hydrolase/transferase [Candidatus Hydrogenedentota bacterium]
MKSSRRSFLKTASATAAALASGSHARAEATRKPNIVLILGDDIGYECYGAYGSTTYKTPNIDKLATTGALFTHAYSQPLCTPSRVQLMTGKHNFRNYTRFGEFDPKEPNFATMLRDAGYRTCVAGKWQLTPANLEGPNQAGFDEYLLWHFQQLSDRESTSEFADKGSRYKSPRLYRDGQLVPGTEGKYGPDLMCDYVTEFIERNRERPFFVYYPMMLVHNPFDPTPESKDWETGGDDKKHFPDMVAYMDKCVGRVIDKLDALGLRENTLVIVTGDNGTNPDIESPLPGRGMVRGGKSKTTDAGTHVAFVANWKGAIAPETVIDTPIDFTDILPTFAEATSATPPPGMDGQSLLPILRGATKQARGWAFMSYSRNGAKRAPFLCSVRDQRWKLYSDGRLYEVPNDYLEEHPAEGPEASTARARLQPILNNILKDATNVARTK